jgi:hypothetical protein
MQDRGYQLRRTPLLCTSVNRINTVGFIADSSEIHRRFIPSCYVESHSGNREKSISGERALEEECKNSAVQAKGRRANI